MNNKQVDRYTKRWFAAQRGETIIDPGVDSYTERWFKTPSTTAYACDVESVFPYMQQRLKEMSDEKD